MGLNLQYIPIGYTQEYFIDKDTGLPLAAGVVTFYADEARTTLKPMYQKTGTPPNYSYTPLPNPMTLSSIGTFNYGGADIIPYFFPYDDDGEIELYYMDVKSAGGINQFTREGEPNVGAETASDLSKINNFITNGQFVLHNKISIDNSVTSAFTWLGGSFAYSKTNTTADDSITFPLFASFTTNPAGSPRYGVEIECTTPGTDTFKTLIYRFTDVNKFASATQQYTYAFVAKSNSGSPLPIQIKVNKSYGAGGSPSTSVTVKDITLSTSYQYYNVPFVFGSNDGKTIGTDVDNYVDIAISFPNNYAFDAIFTDFVLVFGNVEINDFPITTNNQFISRSLFSEINSLPSYDGSNVGLPLILTSSGISYDTSSVGSWIESEQKTAPYGYLAPATVCEYAEYSSDFIPYKRLGDYLWESTISNYRYGTGPAYVTMTLSGSNPILMTYATGSTPTNPADGTPATGFTFAPTVPNCSITTVAGAAIPNNAYFSFYVTGGQQFVVWFNKAGAGVKPTVGTAKYIEVAFTGTETAVQIGALVVIAINRVYYMVDDLRGLFTRAWANGSTNDPDRAGRTAPFTGGIAGDVIGSRQGWQNASHAHDLSNHTHTSDRCDIVSSGGADIIAGGPTWMQQHTTQTSSGPSNNSSGSAGGNQSNPINVQKAKYCKY